MARDYEAVVRALFTKANAEGVTPQEKKYLEDKAYELMEIHHVQIAKDERNHQDIKPSHYPVTFSGLYYKDQQILFNQIALHYNCICVDMRNGTYEISGYDSDIDTVDFLYSIVEPQMFAELSKVHIPTGVHAKRVRNAFLKGYIVKIKERLEAAKRASKEVQEPGNAIILRSRELNVRDYFKKNHPHTSKKAPSRYSDRNAFAQGQEAGTRARFSVNDEVTGRGRELER